MESYGINEKAIKMVDKLYEYVESIKDVELKNFTIRALEHAPGEFWVWPCSGSGKYHPPENNGKGGIIRHTVKAASLINRFCRFFGIDETGLKRDICMSAIILHDRNKNGNPWKERSDPDHGKITAKFLEDYDFSISKKNRVLDCIRYHWGRWCPGSDGCYSARAIEGKSPFNKRLDERIVQLADFISADPNFSFLPDVKFSGELLDRYKKENGHVIV